MGNNAWVTLPRYNWIDRNRFIYPQLQANALGVFNLSYRQMGNQIYFIPNPTAGQFIQVWYVPVMTMLLKDTDMLGFSISGWDEYIVTDVAEKAAIKEESYDLADRLGAQKSALLERIETTASNRDQGIPNTISDTRSNTGFYDGGGFGGTGHGMGGWLVALFPTSVVHNIGNHLLAHSVSSTQSYLGYVSLLIGLSYLFYKYPSQFGGRIKLPRICYTFPCSVSTLLNHIRMIILNCSKPKMIRSYARRVIAFMTNKKIFVWFSKMNPIRSAMGSSGNYFPNWSTDEVNIDSSISFGIKGTQPNPARISLFNFWPKLFLKKFFSKHVHSIAQMGGW